MSGVYIEGIDMPRDCEYLDLVITRDGNVCCYDAEGVSVAKAIPVPDHGDLIDRDEAADDACLIWGRNSSGDDAAQEIIEHLRKMEAVIPADRSEASPCDNCDERNDVGCSWCKMMERSEE